MSFAATINNLTPASTGEVLRAVILRDRHGVPYSRSAAVILVERFWAVGIWFLTALAAATGPLLGWPAPLVALSWLAALAGSFLPTVAYRLGFRLGPPLRRFSRGREPSSRLARLTAGLAGVDDALAVLVTDNRSAIVFVLTTLGVAACFASQLSLCLLALGTGLSPIDGWAALGLATMAGIVSGLPFGLGATDVVLTLLLGSMGIDLVTAGAATLLMRAVQTLPLGIAGTVSWLMLTGGSRPARPQLEARDPLDVPGLRR